MEKSKESKKLLIVLTLLSTFLTVYLIYLLTSVPAIDAINKEYKYIKGAHRGDSVTYTENTLEAIESALNNSEYKFIEFDVQYTKDDQIVLFHDKTLMRFGSNAEEISELTYEELQESTDLKVPLYQEVIEKIESKKPVNIEIKSHGDFEKDKELVDFIVKDITERGIRDNVILSSVSKDIIKYSKQKYPDIETGKIYYIHFTTYTNSDILTKRLYDNLSEIDADFIMLHGRNIHNIEKLIQYKPENITLVFWYFSDEMYIVSDNEKDYFNEFQK